MATELDELDTYPHHLMGGPARPPVQPGPRVMALARDAQRQELADVGLAPPEEIRGAVNWRLAPSLVVLGDEANQANPGRDKSSDGTIGNVAHQKLGKDSDHNPWLVWDGVPWVRARDIDTTGLDLAAAYELGRAKAAAGQLPQVIGGGYFIVFGRITAPDFSGWRTYKGSNPHLLEGHVSVSTDSARFTDRSPWGIFGGPTPPAPSPAPPASPGWEGPDLRGTGLDLRGDQGANGVRVQALQVFMRRNFPLYAKALVDDGYWGPRTSAVIREFGQRTGVRSADGLNIGPQLARKLYISGFRG